MLENYKDVLLVSDLCEVLHCGRNTAYELLHNGTIPNRLIGGKYIIPKSGVIKFLTEFVA